MDGDGKSKPRRGYRPAVEGLESLRLFHAATPGLAEVALDLPSAAVADPAAPTGSEVDELHTLAWDAALASGFVDLLDESRVELVDPEAIRSGLAQLDRYLGRAWSRAGVPPHKHEDCSQTVYLCLLEGLGRAGFDRVVGEVGRQGVREVLSRETQLGPDFFRAVDAVKKRAQRERLLTSLDDAQHDPAAGQVDADWSRTLDEAIRRSLNPREAELIQATLAGETPSEIAERWGVAPKTISNEKTRALHKLRHFLGPVAQG